MKYIISPSDLGIIGLGYLAALILAIFLIYRGIKGMITHRKTKNP